MPSPSCRRLLKRSVVSLRHELRANCHLAILLSFWFLGVWFPLDSFWILFFVFRAILLCFKLLLLRLRFRFLVCIHLSQLDG
jgi:hypothetical protein